MVWLILNLCVISCSYLKIFFRRRRCMLIIYRFTASLNEPHQIELNLEDTDCTDLPIGIFRPFSNLCMVRSGQVIQLLNIFKRLKEIWLIFSEMCNKTSLMYCGLCCTYVDDLNSYPQLKHFFAKRILQII